MTRRRRAPQDRIVLLLKKIRRLMRSAKGFTLIEVVVSVVIVATTAAGIFASFIAAQNYVSRSRGRVSTSNSIRQQIESLKADVVQQEASNWGAPNLNITDTDNDDCADTDDWTGWVNASGTFGGPPLYGKFRRCVSPAGTGPVAGQYREVQTQLNWIEPGT
ncbi:prepilin-type N-terminal cleavage/methylation domain-containing protein [bacterium]|nr:MAG: prepilin-type N-terminal cleavage/methylation domain-containing protein [bacterium]